MANPSRRTVTLEIDKHYDAAGLCRLLWNQNRDSFCIVEAGDAEGFDFNLLVTTDEAKVLKSLQQTLECGKIPDGFEPEYSIIDADTNPGTLTSAVIVNQDMSPQRGILIRFYVSFRGRGGMTCCYCGPNTALMPLLRQSPLAPLMAGMRNMDEPENVEVKTSKPKSESKSNTLASSEDLSGSDDQSE